MLQLRKITKVYKTKQKTKVQALTDINYEFKEKGLYAILGKSGSGKTTLLNIIAGLDKPTSGEVIFEGQAFSSFKGKDFDAYRNTCVGFVFQEFNLLENLNVYKNVSLALELQGRKATEAEIIEVLRKVGIEDLIYRNIYELSGGQKQRVAIARALTTNPKVLLCDEATSALDPNTTRSILKLLKDINKRLGITVVIITHEMSVIEEVCQRVAIIDNSKIAEIGTVEKIFTAPKSSIGKQLVYSESKPRTQFDDTNRKYCRIVFEGETSFKPVLANMILECNDVVNIMYANTRNIDGQAYGQLIVQLPPDDKTAKKMIAYLETQDVKFEQLSELI